jgi:hypothetical protein
LTEHYRRPDAENGCGLAMLIVIVASIPMFILMVIGLFRLFEVFLLGG